MESHRSEGSAESPRQAAEELAVSAETIAEMAVNAAVAVDPRLLPHRLRMLLVIQEHPGINLTGLAGRVDLSLPRASRVCGALESAGLLERHAVAADRREIELVLTPAGAALLADYRARRATEIADVIRRMPVAARRELLAGLRSFTASLAAVRGKWS
jgi:DNA-binding MarR family transcriptional regulator